MEQLLSPLARSIKPYVPGEQPKDKQYIKLNTNENPYPQSPRVTEAVEAAVDRLPLYSRPEMDELRRAIANDEGLPGPEWVYTGNGSDEILALAFRAFFGGDKPVLFPDITYSFYPVYCHLFEIAYREISLDVDLDIRLEDYQEPCCGIVFPNPNAPTGRMKSVSEIETLLKRVPNHVLMLDEAYIMFGGESVVGLIQKYPNLVVTRTLSKSHSLAGLRCGYIMAQPSMINAVRSIKNSFNSYTMDTLAQEGARAAIEDKAYALANCRKVIQTRDRFSAQIAELGFVQTPSKSNFLFCTHPKMEAERIFEELKQRGILVRYFDKPARISSYLRITIGTDAQMDAVATALEEIRKACP